MNHEAELLAIVRRSPWFMAALGAVRSLGLSSWCIGAGAVRNLVWDHLHDYREPSRLPDVDVAYFDGELSSQERERELEARLKSLAPEVPWEVTNQASVHLWFEAHFGHAVPPLRSLEEAIASWPEYATAVGITSTGADSLTVIAPHGLDDLFSMIVRRNPIRVSPETYRRRVDQKQYGKRWPKVTIIP